MNYGNGDPDTDNPLNQPLGKIMTQVEMNNPETRS